MVYPDMASVMSAMSQSGALAWHAPAGWRLWPCLLWLLLQLVSADAVLGDQTARGRRKPTANVAMGRRVDAIQTPSLVYFISDNPYNIY